MAKLAMAQAPRQAQANDYIDDAERVFAGQLRDLIVEQAVRLAGLADDAAKVRNEYL